MNNFEPGLTKYNTAPPPNDFKRKNSWEIKERALIKSEDFTPFKLPTHDDTTEFKEVSGKARYLVEEKPNVGTGGMSNVFRGWDSRLERYVAVKELLPDWLDSGESYRNIIELEAKTIEKLKKNFHPGIPNIYDYIETRSLDGRIRPLLIMELIEGESLFLRLSDDVKQPLAISEISNIITQTADTVDFMNENDLIHKDIKPKNIILSQPHIKIIDYGSSSWIPDVDAVTASYTSPETYINNTKDARSDEYSLAATAYSIFFGNPPDIIENPEIITEAQFYSKSFKYKVKDLDIKKLINIFRKSLSKNPDDRYQTSTEFAQAFCKIIKNVGLKD
ncbi:hypothetical protein CO165_00030 [Candidatus Roizmanbacteria bacterium CG_4_9_14_3_um_filter_33_18]|uniref:Protein kinase domain-containing protein n=3 Tax=Candidatus Roizmaniibacteriota TaxID=1752723 RepID=A0A2M7U9G0_9BACT|nr:MAG: hypothetical protein COW97_00760 [Candidatus Roizmanbacteria bacterium CG22_combo_CG10-13_8_21_14_all_34_12]PIZ67809.1 MAG: hypothetical protein COY12_01180 [Candidatus Roizmanbacteria bacterium CG_4_10_14_0_2_um_filter_33_96]PJA56108.1 MAG: hypothetical protein CO165_00030 [Candidatus Roizmanbacteria bacterium CG_4_9_14_3_um_filter_33_18]